MIQLIPVFILFGTFFFEVLTKRKLKKGEISEENLSTKEKVLTWFVCIFNPVLAGAILYYGWKKVLPNKAKQANKISMIAFLIEILLGIALVFISVPK